MSSSIPLDALGSVRDPEAVGRLQQQFGGTKELDKDGSMYASIGNRPIPPPKALRKIHAHRQDERRQREEEEEAVEFEREMAMGVRESRTSLYTEAESSAEATRRRREQAQQDLEARLCDTAWEYEVAGCGVPDCDGTYSYSEAASNGAPVYRSANGWILHRDRPPEVEKIGTDDESRHFGWLLSKDRKPFYATRTEELVAPSSGWQCFYGPPPAPTRVVSTTWESHFLGACGALKDEGNRAVKAGQHQQAERLYGEGLDVMDGYDEVVDSSRSLQELRLALHANRAEARLRLQLWESSLEDSLWVLEREPCHAKAAVRLAKAYKALGRLNEAAEPLGRLLAKVGPRCASAREVQAWQEEAEVLRSCAELEASPTQQSPAPLCQQLLSVHRTARQLWEAVHKWLLRQQGGQLTDAEEQLAEQEHLAAAQALGRSLQRLQRPLAEDAELRKALGLLLRGHGVLDLATEALSSSSSSSLPAQPDDDEEEEEPRDWGLEVLTCCCACSPELPLEPELRRLLAALSRLAPSLARSPRRALRLVQCLLRHRLRQSLCVADSLVEARGLLARCLRPWARLLDDKLGNDDIEETAATAAEVLQELAAQVQRLDNAEALSLALFVECFVGERLGSGAVSGGFVLQSGGAVRRVVLALLRHWSENSTLLRSLSPELVSKVWASARAKLRRDAEVEVAKEVPSAAGKVKMEWFKLKPMQALRKGLGAFHPEELAAALLHFLGAHLKATCERGCEEEPKEGIAPRSPAEEWAEEVLDRPFGWGTLLPMIVAPSSIASEALLVLETLVERHPHNEKIAKRIAGLLAFLPLLRLPWPQAQPVESHLGATLAAGPIPRRSACVVLQCAMDTEMGMRVAKDHVDLVLESVLDVLSGVLKDREQPASVIAASELLGLLGSNLGCLSKIPEEIVYAILEEFVRSTHSPTRAQLAKLLRLMHTDQVAKDVLHRCVRGEQLALAEEQQSRVMQEIFDARTLAGQAVGQRLAKAIDGEEKRPVEPGQTKDRLVAQADSLAAAIHESCLKHRPHLPRVLVLGRLARALSRSLEQASDRCQIVLGETTLERLSNLGQRVTPVLLPAPQVVRDDPHLASQELFDFVIAFEPTGYLDVAEYADKLRPYIRRRQKEDDRKLDQVQLICVEARERLEDARDELFSAGYYLADHDEALPVIRRAVAKAGHDVTLLSLPSAEKERRKATETEQAQKRKLKRDLEEVEKAEQEEEEQVERTVLYTSLFDPVLMQPEDSCLPVAYEVGAARGEADVVLIWLPGNSEGAELWRPSLESLLSAGEQSCRLRAVAASLPEGCKVWHSWTDEGTVGRGMEYYSMSDMPTEEAIEKAAKDPAANVSFGRPTYEELRCVAEIEVCSKQLMNLVLAEVRGSSTSTGKAVKVILGGFSQGGAVAAYTALAGAAPEEAQEHVCAVVLCCSGVPAFHFLASKMQAACLRRRDTDEEETARFPAVHMIYCRNDPEVTDNYVQTIFGLCKRFEFPAEIHRFDAEESQEDETLAGQRPLPGRQPASWLAPALAKAVAAES